MSNWLRKLIPWKSNIIEATAIKPTNTTAVTKTPTVKTKVLSYGQVIATGRGQFVPPEYDLREVHVITDTDSYVRQAFSKKIGLMFKEGVDLVGKDPDILRYCKTRFHQISRATNIPHIELLKRLGASLIATSNAFLIKVRDDNASGGNIWTSPEGKVMKPIAGLFPAAPETMRMELDSNGNLLRWKQELPNGRYKFFNKDDVVHFVIDRREGFLFGIPSLVPVIDDIRALRQIEENIELLVYQHLFPLFHWKVGTETQPATLTEEGYKETDIVRAEVASMPAEGGIVTDHRHEINAIGAEGRAIRADGYLEHFKKRVIAGLGISTVDLGDGATTNRSTAQTMSRSLVDAVKSIQDSFEAQFDQFIVADLLRESKFTGDILAEETMVHLRFKEIDIQNKIEYQEHLIKLFTENGITYPEFRAELGREPIEIPEDPEDQDPTKYPDWHSTYWKLFKEPETLIKAVDEAYSAQAQAAAAARASGMTKTGIATAGKAQEEKEARQAKAVVAAKPKATTSDSAITSYRGLRQDILLHIQKTFLSKGYDEDYIARYFDMWAEDIIQKLTSEAHINLIRGYQDQTGTTDRSFLTAKKDVENRIGRYINRIKKTLVKGLKRQVDQLINNVSIEDKQPELTGIVYAVFDITEYRMRFLQDLEPKKAYNFGRVLGMVDSGAVAVRSVAIEDACEACLQLQENLIFVDELNIDDIAPHHPGCQCELQVAIDGVKLESCVKQVKSSLKKKNPSWSAAKIKSSAFAICKSRIKE